MTLQGCAFETRRLRVKDWHDWGSAEWAERDLATVMADMLTEPVTAPLPPAWHGTYSVDRARNWIAERDAEGKTLLIVDVETREAIGLVLLFESRSSADQTATEVRLGYLLAEAAWGRGFASELVAGFVTWCRGHPPIAIVAGVVRENVASARVLIKNGFARVPTTAPEDEDQYRLDLS